ncbi:MAG: tetratricopeptide repeat protein [Pseudomonadota bacterium]
MSDSDSFINEVSEEVRKDALFGYVKRYSWIALLVILGLVGGAGYSEWSKSQNEAKAQATGDALLAALNETDLSAQAAMLAEMTAEGPEAAVVGLLTAAAQQEAGEGAAAVATLQALAANTDVPEIYRDVAVFKSALIDAEGIDPAARRQTLQSLTAPGLPFRLMAQEQLALMDISSGDTDAAIATLRGIIEDAEVTRGLRERAQTLIVALGEELEPAASEDTTE